MKREQTGEQKFPDPRGRRAMDRAIDAYRGDSLAECIELAEQEYFKVTGASPMRRPK